MKKWRFAIALFLVLLSVPLLLWIVAPIFTPSSGAPDGGEPAGPAQATPVAEIALPLLPRRYLPSQVIAPGQGVSLSQVDFTWPNAQTLNSNTGWVHVDVATLRAMTGMPSGYINITSSFGWIVQNLPIFADFDYPAVTTEFQLSAASGSDVTALDALVLYSTDPLVAPPAGSMTAFPVGDVAFNGAGKGDPPSGGSPTPPAPGIITFTPFGSILDCEQPGHPNVQAADAQCGPAAFANSLQWLENTYGIPVPHPHLPGLGPDGSLVGTLDGTMSRTWTDRKNGDGVTDENFLDGVLEYIAEYCLSSRLNVKHQDDSLGGDFSAHGLTSEGFGVPTADFILAEVCAGEDVEIGYTNPTPPGGGHWVNAVKAGTILGVPFVCYQSDIQQTSQGDPDDTRGTDTVQCSFLSDVDGDGLPNLVNEANCPDVDIVVSESPVSPQPTSSTPPPTPITPQPTSATPGPTRTPVPTCTCRPTTTATATPTPSPTTKPVLTGVSSTFVESGGVITLTAEVVQPDLSGTIYGLEFLYNEQNPPWLEAMAMDHPPTWFWTTIPGALVFETADDPLIRGTPVTFVLGVYAQSIGDTIVIHATDKNHNNLGYIYSQRVP